MKKPLFALLLSIAALQGAYAQTYVMRIPHTGLTQAPLTVTSVSPALGLYGAATQFTITGENFDETLEVKLGDITATCGVPTKTTVVCSSPLQPTDGSYPVIVRRQDGGRDATKSFTYTPTGPSGVLVKIASAQVSALALTANDELLYLNGGYVNKIAASGAFLGTVFAGSSGNKFDFPSGCSYGYMPNLNSLAVDASGGIYLGGSCQNSFGTGSAVIWKMYNSTYATALTSAWGGSDNHNAVNTMTINGGTLFVRFWTTYATGTYHAQISAANGYRTNLPNNVPWASNVAYSGAPYLVNTSGQLARYVSGGWSVVGPALAGNPSGSYLTASADGFLYYLPSNGTVLYKLNGSTGATAKSWPLSGLSGSITGMEVTRAGKPFISTSSGVWRMD